MSQNEWELIQTIFEKAVALEDEERASFIDKSCSTNPTLRREVERLLAAHDAAEGFLSPLDGIRNALLIAAGADEDDLPEMVGRYRVVRVLGSGAMGIVYLAHDPQLDRAVAIKVLRTPRAGQRLLEEARAASAFDHPNIAPVYEIGETANGAPFIAMAYCEGESLAARIARGPLQVTDALRIAQQIADALAAAHALGIVHRDVKPANVIVSSDGRARLMDFGVARFVGREGNGRTVAGTPAYMSPEQIAGEAGAPASDVWALGVVLYEILTGRLPFPNSSRSALRNAILNEPPARLHELRASVAPALVELIESCLAKNPQDRYGTAAEVAAQLKHLAQAGAQRSTRRTVIIGAAVVAMFVVGGIIASNRAEIPAGENALVVLPFTPLARDSVLERVGRELVVTLSTSLDGVAGQRVVEPITVLGQREVKPDADANARASVARRLGASTMISGQLARTGNRVRLDASVFSVKDLTVGARVSAEGALDDIGALTDSLTVALLRKEWRGRAKPAPNLSALTTRSVPALRAYLEGEIDIAGARFRSAPEAFARAIKADSTFWFAYWRYMYARSYHSAPVDSSIVAAVTAHRAEFPEPDRMLVDARLLSGQRARLDARRNTTIRHPTYWPAFFELGDQLTHHGPFLGESLDEAQTALRRAAELNPGFVPAWEHLFWNSLATGDTALGRQALERLTALDIDSVMRGEWTHPPLEYYQYLNLLNRSGGQPDEQLTAVGVNALTLYPAPGDPERAAATLSSYGFYRAQVDLSRAIVQRRAGDRTEKAHHWGLALAWAGRGAWDSAFAAVQQYARTTSHPSGALWAYGLASTGAWLGGVPVDVAGSLREGALRSTHGRSVDGAAEIAWIDGLLACKRGDRAELGRQLALLQTSAATGAPTLASSLVALDETMAGRGAEAGRALDKLESDNADYSWQFTHGARHPYVIGVNRLVAGRLLLAAGDTARAVSLLRMHEVDLPSSLHPLPIVSVILGTYAFPGLARVENARGRREEAHRYRRLYAERVDRVRDLDVLNNAPVCGAR